MHLTSNHLVLLVCALLHTVASVQPPTHPPGSAYDLERSYEIDFTKDTDGGCKKYEKQLNVAFMQALEMVDAARQAVVDLQKPMPADTDANDQNEWKRKAQVYYAMFGEQPSKENGGMPGDTTVECTLTPSIPSLYAVALGVANHEIRYLQ